ncbi:RNase J family beta-CASP ribonuclease [Slackia faecicanis]|uniref:Ribonuclease J n=1 Tax=Slackia faecicanis TaxID=255723 RepID=A0A3N0AI02_9ACTN|nr:RNase J family beta-CASP ribonuclease [Slackia faecicanis]
MTPEDQMEQESFSKPRTRNASKTTGGTRRRAGVKKNPAAKLKIIPLGGLDAIGKNMTVFECGDDMLLVDAGLMFPDDDHPGIDLILPDYTYVLENEHKLRGIIITHGHEDHTGSLPYLMKDLSRKVPIYGTKMTLGLIEGKFNEHRVKAKLAEIKAGDEIKLGGFIVDFFAVNHSIPGAVGVFMQSAAGNVLHTGDFKLDQSPIDGVHTDFGALARFSKMGVDLMMSDSTNAQNPNFTPSEAEVGRTLRRIIENAKGRVIIASFASHIHRLQQIADAAVANGRKVVVTGRSMVQNTDIARRLGYLKIQDVDLIDAYDLKGTPPEKVVIMCTGSQGEPLSALARIANGEHRTIQIDQGDTVIISATPVPGNEKAVTRVVNSLAKIGCEVYDKKRAMVHVSGHAGAEELKLVLSIVQPKHFMPVHGESTHLRAHARLAEATGVDPRKIFLCENGDTLELSEAGVRFGEPVESGIVYVDGLSVGDTSRDVLDERQALSNYGIATIAAAVNVRKKQIEGPVRVEMRGITGGDVAQLRREAGETVKGTLRRALDKGTKGKDLEKVCRDALLSLLWERTKQRPMVVCAIIEL